MAQKFQDLFVWQKTHKLVIETYNLAKSFPEEEKFGLISQMRRAAVSIAANIAEGFKKKSELSKSNFYNISQGSLEELRYYYSLSSDLDYIDEKALVKFEEAIDEIAKMLFSLDRKILKEKN